MNIKYTVQVEEKQAGEPLYVTTDKEATNELAARLWEVMKGSGEMMYSGDFMTAVLNVAATSCVVAAYSAIETMPYPLHAATIEKARQMTMYTLERMIDLAFEANEIALMWGEE